MGQFSLKRLFASVTLIALGIGDITFLNSNGSKYFGPASNSQDPILLIMLALVFLGGTLIGAGVLNLWKRAGPGAILGTLAWGGFLAMGTMRDHSLWRFASIIAILTTWGIIAFLGASWRTERRK